MTLAKQMLEDSRLMSEAKTTPPIKVPDLINLFWQARKERWGYIWGTRGQVWTQSDQDKATREMTIQHGQQWVGKRVADCSGLFVWAFKTLGESIYHGSDTIFRKHCRYTGPLAGDVSIAPGTAVFQNVGGKRTHIGLYVGGGKCIEAQGTRTGVVESRLDVWDEWGELEKVDYLTAAYDSFELTKPQTTRVGDAGELVEYIQQALLQVGYDLGSRGADGHFGAKTEAAVKKFQAANGLPVDGIVGPKTWPLIKAVFDDAEPEDEPDEAPSASTWEAMTLEEKVEDLHQWRLSMTGGGERNV
jgi:hypothetical protein